MPGIVSTEMDVAELTKAISELSPGTLRGACERAYRQAKAEEKLVFKVNPSFDAWRVEMAGEHIGTARLYAYKSGVGYWQMYVIKTGTRIRAPKWPMLRHRLIEHLKKEDWL